MPRVLLADDDPIVLKYLGILLEKNGYDCITATNGIEALEKVRACAPDLILLDVNMPEADGLDVCKQLKSDSSTQHIPIIMVTGSIDKEWRIKGLSAGANDFLTKPIDRSELMVRVRNLLKIKEFGDFLKNYNELLKREVEEKERVMKELREALANVKKLSGLLPIFASCKKIRNDQGYWTQIETYIHDHSEADFSHGMCPDCLKKLYPDLY